MLVGIGIQPLSATAVFMAYEIAGLYPEIGRSSLSLPLFAAAIEHKDEVVDALRERLEALDVDALSPREALDLLYELKREAGKLP